MGSRILGRASTVLIVAAALALAAWFAFSAISGARLVAFRTGSMSPAMPQGAVAMSVPVAAAEIRVGDVVTVRRAGAELPVTHRVVEVRGAEAASERIPAGARELVLKGDDNDRADARPYVVREAHRVVFSAPGLGAALALLQSPIGMGALILAAGALTVWAFWPRRQAPR